MRLLSTITLSCSIFHDFCQIDFMQHALPTSTNFRAIKLQTCFACMTEWNRLTHAGLNVFTLLFLQALSPSAFFEARVATKSLCL